MLAALLYGREDLRLETLDVPTPAEGEVVIEVLAATTCGTDLKVWRRGGHAKMLKPPTRFGHEAAGKIVSLGAGVTDWQLGDRVECLGAASNSLWMCWLTEAQAQAASFFLQHPLPHSPLHRANFLMSLSNLRGLN